MAEDIIKARVWTKVDTLENWNNNPLLLGPGEMALVTTPSGIPLNMKWGDKTERKRFSDLPFVISYDQGQFVVVDGPGPLPTPESDVAYSLVGPGTYTYPGQSGIVVGEGRWGQVVYTNGEWSFIDMGGDISELLSPLEQNISSLQNNKEDKSNKSNEIDSSSIKFPTNRAVKDYVDEKLNVVTDTTFGGVIDSSVDLTDVPEKIWFFAVPGTYQTSQGELTTSADLSIIARSGSEWTVEGIYLDVTKEWVVCSNVDELRSLDPYYIGLITSNLVKGVQLLGYYEKGDTPSPIEYYLSYTTESDDGGSVIEVGGVKLVHEFKDSIDLIYFGTSENIEDNSVIINRAIEYASNKGVKEVVNNQNLNCVVKEESERWRGCIEMKSGVHFINNGVIKISPTNQDRYAIIGAEGVKDIQVKVGTILGDKYTHLTTSGEWGMGIGLRDVENYKVYEGLVQECWGDGVYITGDSSVNYEYTDGCKNGIVDLVTVKDNRRNGMAAVAFKDLKITRCKFVDTDGKAPMAGLDIEPNTNQKCSNLVVDQCESYGNTVMSLSITSHGVASGGRLIGVVDGVSITNSRFEGRIQVSQSTNATERVVRNVKIDKISIKSINDHGLNVINNAGDVTITNSEIEIDSSSSDFHGVRLYATSNNFVMNVKIKGSGYGNGVYLQESSYDNRISSNDISGFYTGVANGAGKHNLIQLNDVKDCSIGVVSYGDYTKILNNNFFNIEGVCINVISSVSSRIMDNTVPDVPEDHSSYQIDINNSYNTRVSGNNINNAITTLAGVRTQGGSGTKLTSNTINSGVTGFFVATPMSYIVTNSVDSTSQRGYWVFSRNCNICQNTAVNTGSAGLEISGNGYCSVLNNVFDNCGLNYNSGGGRSIYLSNGTVGNNVGDNIVTFNVEGKTQLYAVEAAQETYDNQIYNVKTEGGITNVVRKIPTNTFLEQVAQQITPATKGVVTQVSSTQDAAEPASGATPTKEEFDALLAELRDLKTKMRQGEAPILAT